MDKAGGHIARIGEACLVVLPVQAMLALARRGIGDGDQPVQRIEREGGGVGQRSVTDVRLLLRSYP